MLKRNPDETVRKDGDNDEGEAAVAAAVLVLVEATGIARKALSVGT